MLAEKLTAPDKVFKLNDVAYHLDVKKHIIRQWEKDFDIKPDQLGRYTGLDLKKLYEVKELLVIKHYSVAQVRSQLGLETTEIANSSTLEALNNDSIEVSSVQQANDLVNQKISPAVSIIDYPTQTIVAASVCSDVASAEGSLEGDCKESFVPSTVVAAQPCSCDAFKAQLKSVKTKLEQIKMLAISNEK